MSSHNSSSGATAAVGLCNNSQCLVVCVCHPLLVLSRSPVDVLAVQFLLPDASVKAD